MAIQPTRVSQIPVNVVYSGDVPTRVSQVAVEVIYLPIQPNSVTQIPINVSFDILPPDEPISVVPLVPIIEEWEWKTVTHRAANNRTQRQSVRQFPRVSYRYEFPAIEDEDFRTLFHIAWRNVTRTFHYPAFHMATPITVATAPGGSVVEFDRSDTDIRQGDRVALLDAEWAIVGYADVTALGVDAATLDTPQAAGVPLGYWIAPAPAMRLLTPSPLAMNTHHGRYVPTWVRLDSRELVVPGEASSLNSYDGYVILPQNPVVFSDDPVDYDYGTERVDNGVAPAIDYTWYRNPILFRARTYLIDKADMAYWRLFGDTIRGGQKRFLLPSFRNDLTLQTAPALGATKLEFREEMLREYAKEFAHRYLRIETANGVIFRRMDNLDIDLNSGRAIVTLDTALGGSTGDNVIDGIGLVSLVRMSSDKMTFQHHHNYILVSFATETVNE